MSYDIVFITSIPSFYKINLYKEISKYKKIFVIFIASNSNIRTDDFVKFEVNFEYKILYHGELENKKSTIFKLIYTITKLNYKKVIVGGWDLIEYWITIFLSKKEKNFIAVESSVFESKIDGFLALLKRFFLFRCQGAYATSTPQKELLKKLNFEGSITITYGVGLINLNKKRELKNKKLNNSFLYVGRLSKEKNIEFLIKIFNELDYKLTIVGNGYLENRLKQLAKSNISFLGYINNKELANIYLKHDVFILPSLIEPWGLVVEEALYYGLPIVLSNKVGAIEFVKEYNCGVSFDVNNTSSLKNALIDILNNYETYKKNVLKLDFNKRIKKQIDSYLF